MKKIGDSIWLMESNKPIQFWVWEVITREYKTHESDYGQPYGHKVVVEVSYVYINSSDNRHGARSITTLGLNQNKIPYFNTKEELIASL